MCFYPHLAKPKIELFAQVKIVAFFVVEGILCMDCQFDFPSFYNNHKLCQTICRNKFIFRSLQNIKFPICIDKEWEFLNDVAIVSLNWRFRKSFLKFRVNLIAVHIEPILLILINYQSWLNLSISFVLWHNMTHNSVFHYKKN